MANGLTDIAIRKLKPREGRSWECPDGGTRGLYVFVGVSGAKSFVVRYRLNGKPQKLTLGPYVPHGKESADPKVGDPLTLAAARKLAADTMLQLARGRDPGAAKRDDSRAKQQAAADTFEVIALEYLRRAAGMKIDDSGNITFDRTKMRSGRDRYRVLRRQIFPAIGSIPVTEIKKSDVVRLLDKIEAGELRNDEGELIKGGPVAADRALALIRKVLNWHAERSDDFRPPMLRLKPRRDPLEQARDRVLSDDELRVIWRVSGEMPGPFGSLLRFLLLTAARRAEASLMTWAEVIDGNWTLPAERNKAASRSKVKDLVRPLSKMALAVLEARPKIMDCPYVFTNGSRPLTGYGEAKAKFDAAVLKELRKANRKAKPFPQWGLHDLRRTARTLMSRAGVNPHHAERCLGHVIRGVEGIYDQHRYRVEMQAAYEALATLIDRIVHERGSGVIPFRR
jgi:integrase